MDSTLFFNDKPVLGGQLKCSEEPVSGSLNAYRAYIRDHVEILAKGNPEVFRGDFDSDRICVAPVVTGEPVISSRLDGTLLVDSGLVKATETDAQFAAAVAHGLAHIVLRHDAENLRRFVDRHPEYQSKYVEWDRQRQEIAPVREIYSVVERDRNRYLDSLRSSIREKWSAAYATGKPLALNGMACNTISEWGKLDSLRIEVQKKLPSSDWETLYCHKLFKELNLDAKIESQLAGFKEIEADKIGFEYFLMAGFPEDEYAQFFMNAAHVEKSKPCLAVGGDSKVDCWRTGNIRSELKVVSSRMLARPGLVLHDFGDRLSRLREIFSTY
ncbi:MAG: hypothetical protein EOP10_01470 [Proteobacteria bacterium]|nr:MAG: hypothetical protein EOP10_01470 [Pseudomonadota bacterium]